MKNPIISGNYADPFVYRDGNDYYLVATTEDSNIFEIHHSLDLKHWSAPKTILRAEDIAWAKTNMWAPSLVKHNGYWYFAFCAEGQIGIAVCDTPMGIYRDVLGQPLLPKNTCGIQTIDPSLFQDDDGKTYLLFGNSKCFISEIFLSPDNVYLIGEMRNLSDAFYDQRTESYDVYKPWIFCEGADLVKYRGKYLLTFSVYDFRDYRYNIRYAWADQVTGPYIQPLEDGIDNILIKQRKGITATGHGNLTVYKNRLYCIYHRRDTSKNHYLRNICCNRVIVKGKHLQVKAT